MKNASPSSKENEINDVDVIVREVDLHDIEMHGALTRAGLPHNYIGAGARRAA